jgi:uncharacterized protein with HEPN domain
MERSPEAYLLKVEEAAAYILRRAEGRTVEEYLDDEDLRFAIERNFILIGEAMVLLRRYFPEISAEIEAHGKIIDFRNFIVHQYWDIDDEGVWAVISKDVAPLKAAVEELLKKLDAAE